MKLKNTGKNCMQHFYIDANMQEYLFVLRFCLFACCILVKKRIIYISMFRLFCALKNPVCDIQYTINCTISIEQIEKTNTGSGEGFMTEGFCSFF